MRQQFLSPADEAFYGLGQHQQDVINFKGQDVTLLQNNSEVAVPFVLSSKSYGILWDNYSLSKFGDIREYQSINSLKLEDTDGKPGALTATYTSRKDPAKVFLKQPESKIAYLALPDMKTFPKGYDVNDGLVTWEGTISPNEAGVHKFRATYAGYVKLWFDGELVFDKWRQCWNPSTHLFARNLEADKKYPVKIEWIPDGGESYVGLEYLSPISAEAQNELSLFSEVGDKIDYYFIAGDNADDVIGGYRQITGKAPIMPIWAMGLWQSRERYRSQKEMLDVVAEFRKRRIPLDNIVLDWQYWRIDQWGSHAFDSTRFPDPDGMIDQLHDQYNTHFMISVWPKFYEGVDNYKLFDGKGWLYKRNIDNRQKDWIGYISTFYDAFNPEARTLFWDLVNKNLYSKGVDAWWMDATEPDILSNSTVEERKNLMNPTYLGPATRYFNAFPLQNAKGIYEGQRSEKPNDRVFILTRSAYAGQQRFAAATWSGDIGARWYDLKAQIPAGVNFSMSGIPYWTSDIGGFAVEKRFERATGETREEWREQMARWFQFGAFCPLFRVHGQYPFREMFNVAPENHPAYQSMLYYDNLRYKLMPYIYSLAAHVHFDDYTIMRGLVMDFPNDATALNTGDEFMYGPAFLVCPVYTYKATERTVYLPQGARWYH
ncbi:MAG: alpha-xylosidase, partial [Bacteroidia bacterium]|nr:alpha-xylosidase [Bacteroidia bacterium]